MTKARVSTWRSGLELFSRDTTSGEEGLELLAEVFKGFRSTLPVVVMTAWSSVDLAVEAMRQGARDFVQKPWENERLSLIVRTQLELSEALRRGHRLKLENKILRGENLPDDDYPIAGSMQPVLDIDLARGSFGRQCTDYR